MLHRGKKCFAELRILKKKSLVDDRDIAPQRRKGGGGWRTEVKTPGVYYWDYDPDVRAKIVARSESLIRQAGYCESYSPETAEELRTQAENFKRKADELATWEREDTIRRRRRNLYRFMAGKNRYHGRVNGPYKYYRKWESVRDGVRYYYRVVAGWCWWEEPSRINEPRIRMRKAQYTAYYVPQEYPAAPHEFHMPVELYDEIKVIPYECAAKSIEDSTREENFMGGVSYRMLSPLDTLKLISAGSIFGEPMYYHEGDNEAPASMSFYGLDWQYCGWYEDKDSDPTNAYFRKMSETFSRLTASQVMEKVIDEALSDNFEGVLKWAVELREKFLMRLNPQVIIVRAAVHPKRAEFTRHNPGKFQEYAQKVMTRGDDVIHQLEYWLATHGTKNGIPAILKRSWAKNIASMNAYSMSKYCRAGVGLVDTVRICHAKSSLVDTLMREGRVPMPEGQNTWERLRASGKSWREILTSIKLPHMALLRNLRGIFREVEDPKMLSAVLNLLKAGVRGGKQFPFRYYTAWKIFEDEKSSWLWEAVRKLFPWHERIQQALEECIDISCENLPELSGRCAFLTDNSGSAWNAHTSEHGSISMAEIGNLSAVIGAVRAEKGVVYPFGDMLRSVPITKSAGVLEQARLVNSIGSECGMSTENGLYAFFRDAINQGQHWDNIFIYSDMQTGSSRKFGINTGDFRKLGAVINGDKIDINELVKEYRERVNPKLNIVCVQTSGYTNTVMPEYGYRSSILCGWTGKELVFAEAVSRLWDEIESRGGNWLLEPDPEMINFCGF